jgi:hypothetical protein
LNSTTSYKIPLGEMLALLKAGGYELSIQQILEIQSILLSSPLSHIGLKELKYIITPVIAKNHEEQQDIYRIIDGYIREKTRPSLPQHGWRHWMARNARLVFALKIAGFLLLVATGILIYFLTETGNVVRSARRATADTIPSIVKDTSRPTIVKPTIANKDTASIQRPDEKRDILPLTARAEAAEEVPPPEKGDINLQLSLTFGFIIGAIIFHLVFYESSTRLSLRKKNKPGQRSFPVHDDSPPVPHVAAYEKAQEFANINLEFAERDYLLRRPAGLAKIRSHLKKPKLAAQRTLDIRQSIYQSARSGGLTSLSFTDEWIERKYIIITDNKRHEAHITHLLNYVVHFLSANVKSIARYSFTNDIRELTDAKGKTVYLEELSYNFPHHHLVIISHGDTLFNVHDLSIKEDVKDILRSWASKSMITPVPLPDWSYKESLLEKTGFNVVPAEIEAIEMLAKSIDDRSELKQEQLARRMHNLYSVASFDLENVDELQAYLDDEPLFQAVCALAVYPALKWPVTLALFDAIAKQRTGLELSYDNLLKLSRIPWMHANKFEQALRLQLLGRMKPETEIIARETMIKLLDEAKGAIPQGSLAFKEFQTQFNINAFFLYARDQYTYQEYAGVKDVIVQQWDSLNEWALKKHVSEQGIPILQANRSKTYASVEEFILKEEQFEKQKVNLTRLAILTLPAIILYILFSIFQPDIAKVQRSNEIPQWRVVIRMDPGSRAQLTQLVSTVGNTTRTFLLDTSKEEETVMIPEVAYHTPALLEFYSGNTRSSSIMVRTDRHVIVTLTSKPLKGR